MHRILVKCISARLNLHHCKPFPQYVGLENHEIILFLMQTVQWHSTDQLQLGHS